MNAGISRCWRYSRSITMPSLRAFSMASSTLPPVPASAESKTQKAPTCWCPGRGGRGTFVRRAALLEVEGRRQLVVLDVDELGRVARLGGGAGHDDGDDLAGERDPVDWRSASGSGVTWSGVIGQALMQHALLLGDVAGR